MRAPRIRPRQSDVLERMIAWRSPEPRCLRYLPANDVCDGPAGDAEASLPRKGLWGELLDHRVIAVGGVLAILLFGFMTGPATWP